MTYGDFSEYLKASPVSVSWFPEHRIPTSNHLASTRIPKSCCRSLFRDKIVTMAMYVHNLSSSDQRMLDGLEFKPFIRHDFEDESPDYYHDDANRECDPCTLLDHMAFAQCGGPESRFRRKDLEDFCDIWLREHPGQFPDEDFICGSWPIDDWPEFGDEAVTIVQFKTFRICVRADPDEEMIRFVP